jgi:alpha-N-acetylglucosamine transferase
MNYAYTSLLATDDYLYGVLGLYASLCNVETAYPFHLIVTDNVSQDSLDILNQCNITYSIFPRKDFQHPNTNYLVTFNKFYMCELKQYDEVCFLDADVIVTRNIDHVFDYSEPVFFTVFPDYLSTYAFILAPAKYRLEMFEPYRFTHRDAHHVFVSMEHAMPPAIVYDETINTAMIHQADGGCTDRKWWKYYNIDSVDKLYSFIYSEIQNNYASLLEVVTINERALNIGLIAEEDF